MTIMHNHSHRKPRSEAAQIGSGAKPDRDPAMSSGLATVDGSMKPTDPVCMIQPVAQSRVMGRPMGLETRIWDARLAVLGDLEPWLWGGRSAVSPRCGAG